MSEPELLPCPFCGHAAFMAPPHEERQEWCIQCAGYMKESRLVNCPGPDVEHAEQSVAVALWNRRAPLRPEIREALEVLLERCPGYQNAKEVVRSFLAVSQEDQK